METSNQLEPATDKKLLPMHHHVLASVIIQNFQMHVQIKHSLGRLQHLIHILTGMFCIYILYQEKYGLNLVDVLEKAIFVHAFGFKL